MCYDFHRINTRQTYKDIMTEEERRELIRKKRRREAILRKRKIRRMKRIAFFSGCALLAVLIIILVVTLTKKDESSVKQTEASESVLSELSSEDGTEASTDTGKDTASMSSDEGEVENTVSQDEVAADLSGLTADQQSVYAQAQRLAAMYDYDSAISLLQSQDGYDGISVYTEAVSDYEAEKAACVAVDVETVSHIFFHSLLNDDRGFDPEVSGDFVAQDNGCWMCSVDEFNTILQQMYDHGCVLVRLRDLVVQTTDEDGDVHFEKNTSLMLPEGKQAVVLSEDDLSYYHAYDNQGIASKLVFDENGEVKCEYINEAGETLVGDYDMVPLLNAFIDEHPDFSYHNAHAIIALTGYNGVFGYRTDSVYKTLDPDHLDENQAVWLEAHPEYSFEQDVADATEIANALKEEGWEFASHTWGHRHADTTSVEDLAVDNEKWVNTVENIVGPVDTIIFAHGSDIAGDEDYDMDNAKYAYFKESGYNFFCNVDGTTPVWMQIRDDYVRSGRVNIDGYRLYQAMTGNESAVADMEYLGIHDIESFFDYARVTPVVIPE